MMETHVLETHMCWRETRDGDTHAGERHMMERDTCWRDTCWRETRDGERHVLERDSLVLTPGGGGGGLPKTSTVSLDLST